MSDAIALWINGVEREFGGRSLQDLLRGEGVLEQAGIAVAVNGKVIRRTEWDRHEPTPGDEVEIVSAVQGG